MVVSFAGLCFLWWLILLAWIAASLDTGMNGLFVQRRIGRFGKAFNVYKIRTMRVSREVTTTVTTGVDPRITWIGGILRTFKIDELPQLFNVLKGDMSFVGPRPDVEEYSGALEGEERLVLSVRPGITGPATIKYRNEEDLLAAQADPEAYNREVIWPDKVQINLRYVRNWSFGNDIRFLLQTIFRR
ncbi:sugar transferase [Chlorobium phaeovibrioides]|uniref:Sugar transferase n=2 Tax=Chlorobium phaeovibrioides TaxID=1094 RepID=A0A3S0NYE8_CHLPH|nr:sugar transferase [Chlorobium phaeovibrioides]